MGVFIMKRFIRIYLPSLFLTGGVLLILSSGFSQVNTGEVLSFPGVIEKVSEDFRFIVVNEARILIFPNTRILDDNGQELKTSDLRPRLRIHLEVRSTTQGFVAQKLMVKKRIP